VSGYDAAGDDVAAFELVVEPVAARAAWVPRRMGVCSRVRARCMLHVACCVLHGAWCVVRGAGLSCAWTRNSNGVAKSTEYELAPYLPCPRVLEELSGTHGYSRGLSGTHR
jgi:hypothetical protein